MSRTKKKGWFVTLLVMVGVVILSIKNQDKIKEWAEKVPFLANLLK
ncbi:hypothetical protein [Mariniflexile gromovii]|uniref:Uncharacterized protein n=1 Tax=Mariniflexile gromovii TaxID=362523 RepID=A0ABS4BP65_9FLAO|nr:hypothetical protein [Mariniflexile gromovii]MBP0902385.1 hypothetical protein [Mariniflexile gromovii]